tara:strand:- start:5858 stop:6946 length:1089 start_codon:yes stop_codon:yes gene_type:complete
MNKSNILFIGQLVPEIEAQSDFRISQAGNNYQHKLIRNLNPISSISIIPIFYDKKILVNDEKIVYINKKLKFLYNRLFRVIFDTFSTLNIIMKMNTNNLLFYNIDKQTLLTIMLSKFILRKNVLLIVADNPNYKQISFYDRMIYFIIRKIDGVLVFNSSVLLNDNQQLLHGLIDKEMIINNQKKINKNIIFSGSLGKTTGFELALNAISKRSSITLFVTGKAYGYTKDEFETLINKYSKFKNIKYLGLLNYDEYIKVLKKCDIAFSLRDPSDLEHQYNFPSKILEYLSQSKIVISTLEYLGFENKFLFRTDFNSKSILKVIDKIYQLDNTYIVNHKIKTYDYLHNNFTKKTLLKKLNILLEK